MYSCSSNDSLSARNGKFRSNRMAWYQANYQLPGGTFYYPYFEEVKRKCDAKHIGYHSLDDMKRLIAFVNELGLKDVTIFRT